MNGLEIVEALRKVRGYNPEDQVVVDNGDDVFPVVGVTVSNGLIVLTIGEDPHTPLKYNLDGLDLKNLSNGELVELSEERGIAVKTKATDEELIAGIQAYQEARS